jgi:hypothetical protein
MVNEQANAGLFSWCDLPTFLLSVPPGDSDCNSRRKTYGYSVEHRVLLMPGAGQHSEEPGFFRLVSSQPELILKAGLASFIKIID